MFYKSPECIFPSALWTPESMQPNFFPVICRIKGSLDFFYIIVGEFCGYSVFMSVIRQDCSTLFSLFYILVPSLKY